MLSLQGQLLAAATKLNDPNFAKTVVLMVQHDGDGALGLVLNRPTEMSVRDAWEQVSQLPCEVEGLIHTGGPCQGPLMVLHASEEASQVRVAPGIHFAAEQGKIEWLAGRSDVVAKFCVGYAGWGPGQIEGELEEQAWLVSPATSGDVFGDADRLWEKVVSRIWTAAGLPISNANIIPIDPRMN